MGAVGTADKKVIHGTAILRCDCKHFDQDERYGLQMRVHNKKQKDEARCTVCLKTRNVKSGQSTKK